MKDYINSTRVLVEPNEDNFIVFYSTVECNNEIPFRIYQCFLQRNDMILATSAIRLDKGSQLVLKFEKTFQHLDSATSVLEFLIMLSGQISCQVYGTKTQTPQIDVYPHLRTMVENSKNR